MIGKVNMNSLQAKQDVQGDFAASDFGHEVMNQLREKRLLDARTILMSEAVTSSTARKTVSDLLFLDSSSEAPIYFYINSPGGEVNSGFAIYDTIRFIRSPVYMITTGFCASIATIINLAVPKARRLGMPNSRFLIHQPLISGQVYGQASDIEITATQILLTREKLNKLISDECGQELKKVEEDTARDYWMSAGEAKEYGLIDRIVKSMTDIN